MKISVDTHPAQDRRADDYPGDHLQHCTRGMALRAAGPAQLGSAVARACHCGPTTSSGRDESRPDPARRPLPGKEELR
jgi:hypothetical protein